MTEPRLVFFALGARQADRWHVSRRCAEANTDAPVLKASSNAGAVRGLEPCGRCAG